ncbi:MAG: hypothetical protein RR248_05250 [Clostridia bacterium]
MTKSKKKTKKFNISINLIVMAVCALAMIVAFFLPFTSCQTIVFGGKPNVENSNGIDLTQTLFTGEPASPEIKAIASVIGISLDDIEFGTFAVSLGAFLSIILGVSMLTLICLGIFLKKKIYINIAKIISILASLVAILTIIGAIILFTNINVEIGSTSYKALMGVGVYIFGLASFASLALALTHKA